MNSREYQLRDGRDPRLAAHAQSPWPAWLWSSDGAHILWANAAGVKLFGAQDAAALAGKSFGPADPHRRQVARLAGHLLPTGAVRLERLRGFGAPPGMLATCACARLDFSDGATGVLVVAMLSAAELQRLDRTPTPAGRPLKPLPESSVRAEIGPAHQPDAAAMDRHASEYERPEVTGEAPAEFSLIDEVEQQPVMPPGDIHDEPSPFVEVVADESSQPPETPSATETLPPETPAVNELPPPLQTIEPRRAGAVALPPWLDQPLHPRRHPLRFIWQMDADGRFQLGSDEFTRLIGARTAAGFGRLWSEIAQTFGLDPQGRVLAAVATRDTWSGIALDWPVDGGERLRVELSGLPMFDRARNFAGYRGFGVCRDLEGLARLDALRRYELFSDAPAPLPAGVAAPTSVPDLSRGNSHQTDLEHAVETPKNVLPFRPAADPKLPSLTPVENNAFNELARQLAERLQGETAAAASPATSDSAGMAAEPPQAPQEVEQSAAPEWLSQPAPAPRGDAARDRMLLDLLPGGVLIWRLDRLLYANRAFLDRVGYGSLQMLEEAGGLDALLVEPGISGSSTSEAGTPVTISVNQSTMDARLHAIEWDGESAHALICDIPRAPAEPVAPQPSPVGHANAEELGAILDTTAEGIVMFDAEGNLNSCNRSAEALFGYDGEELVRRNLAELFAPESRGAVQNYLESIRQAGPASLDHGREVLGRVREGGIIPLSVTMGRTRPQGPNFFAVFHDLSRAKSSEAELAQARRTADRSADARVDALARISHEVRTPLNAIIGFAEVMIEQRFGPLGNERYVEYMKDIRASGERVIAIINDQLDLSRIETGKLDLNFASQNLNDLVEQCVAGLQPQANRERIIIRSSLSPALPPVVADARALRQIVLNLIGNSIHLADAGGQVIVSTALSDAGEVVLRVRDTGHGLNDNEVAAALQPYRSPAPPEQGAAAGVNLSLTKALVEANRAQFHIRPGAQSGTLIEVAFGKT
jgi:PAS domain S-box-containing protein